MFRKVLVPIEDTVESAAAVPLARVLARATQSEVVLVHVLPSDGNEADRRHAERSLERLASELGADGLSVSTQLQQGPVAEQLVLAIQATGVDVVVMATHGRSGLKRALLGSVAERLVHDSPVPVLVVRPGGPRITALNTLLVPVDATPGGALAVAAALDLARKTGARLVLLEVAVPVPLWVFSAEFGGSLTLPTNWTWDEDARASAKADVERLAQRVRDAGVPAEGRAMLGEPAAMIVSVAEDVGADLIVMSTRSLVGPARALLGSTADAVVRTSRRPVLLVRRDGRTEQTRSSQPVAAAAGA